MPDHPSSLFNLSGKTALVTGASRGLGWEIALALTEHGADVHINGRNRETLEHKISEHTDDQAIGKQKLIPAVFDVCDDHAVGGWFQQLTQPLDILVNNMGIRHRRTIEACPPQDFVAVLDANLVAPYRLARLAAATMASGSSIINITSIAGPRARPGDAAYTAAKGGLSALTRALAVELAPRNIRVNGIAPGYFATEANSMMIDDPAVQRFVDEHIPMKRWGNPNEIAGAAVFLSSPGASYVHGHILTVDAGLSVSF
jgi:gluconate 5-dehydrogenase